MLPQEFHTVETGPKLKTNYYKKLDLKYRLLTRAHRIDGTGLVCRRYVAKNRSVRSDHTKLTHSLRIKFFGTPNIGSAVEMFANTGAVAARDRAI